MTTKVDLPKLAGTRERAQAITAPLPSDLSGVRVVVDAGMLKSAAPSFTDELCKIILIDRGASSLVVNNANPRLAHLLQMAADLRSCADRLMVDVVPHH